jgi:hypothetical protein
MNFCYSQGRFLETSFVVVLWIRFENMILEHQFVKYSQGVALGQAFTTLNYLLHVPT